MVEQNKKWIDQKIQIQQQKRSYDPNGGRKRTRRQSIDLARLICNRMHQLGDRGCAEAGDEIWPYRRCLCFCTYLLPYVFLLIREF